MRPRQTKAPGVEPQKSEAGEKDSSARAVLPLSWNAVEYVPKKRWWWFVALGWIGVSLALVFAGIGEWSIFAVVVAGTLTLFVMYLARPRAWNFMLTETQLLVTRESRPATAGQVTLQLDRYRAFIVEQMPRTRGAEPVKVLVLLPVARFGQARDIYLPSDYEQQRQVIEALEQIVPYDDALSRAGTWRAISWLARQLRLS